MTASEQKKFYTKLGACIKEARLKAGLKQETFASFLSLSRASIVNIEKGRQHPPIHLLWVIAKVLKIEVIELLPEFVASDELNPKWDKLIAKDANFDSSLNGGKLINFIKELESSKTS